VIDIEGLTVRYKGGFFRSGLLALDNVDLKVGEGDFFALLGQNGAGKSTAISCLLGFVKPTAGRVSVLGESPVPGSSLFKDIGYLPEEPHYHDYLSVQEAIEYYGRLTGKADALAEADTLIERLGLGEFRKLRILKCSKGMKQKVGIVQCLLGSPRLLLLDEPMRGLDPLAVRELRDILVERNRQGLTVVISSHILSEVEMVASRVAVLDRGRVAAIGPLSEIISTDHETYAVEIARADGLPDYFSPSGGGAERLEGVIPATRFYDFLELTRARSIPVYGCALRKSSLEDAFLRIVKRPA
jgi:ABC-2 type transport system ATP-binding protein